jgi:hypothetical protein
VGVLDDLPRELDVLLERVVRAVDHHRLEPGVDAGLAELERVAVVEVERELEVRVLSRIISAAPWAM